MDQNQDRTYLLVGTVTKDLQSDNSFTIGGTVTYASTIAKNLGWKPVVITRAAPDFTPPEHLTDVEWHILPATCTTTFRNDYYPEGRIQTIGPIAESITQADIPAIYQHVAIVHACPLAQDVAPEVVSAFDQTLLAATPQGWLRQWDETGIVSLGGWKKMETIFPRFQAIVISIEDVEGNWDIVERWAKQLSILIVTQGEAGCTIFHQGQQEGIPTRSANPIDLTGAGDVFATAFFIRLCETNDLRQSAQFANVTASMAIERLGVAGAPTRNEIEAYLAQNYRA